MNMVLTKTHSTELYRDGAQARERQRNRQYAASKTIARLEETPAGPCATIDLPGGVESRDPSSYNGNINFLLDIPYRSVLRFHLEFRPSPQSPHEERGAMERKNSLRRSAQPIAHRLEPGPARVPFRRLYSG